MNHEQYSGSECGKYVKITNKSNGKTVTAKVAGKSRIHMNLYATSSDATSTDMCPGCSYGSIDLSRATFAAIGAYDTGVLPISWDYTSKPEDN
jgi:expansin (peptidoglycan-binding protein)